MMTNEGFADKDEVKIGFTNDLERRRKDLSGTSVSRPFSIAYSVCVRNARELEQFVHHELRDYRINDNREFFSCGVDLAIATIDELMVRYSIERSGGVTDFDYSKARLEQNDEEAYELGEQAYERCGYSTDKKINFEARASNCTSGIAFSEFVRGWRDAEDYEKRKLERESQARAKESEAAARVYAVKESAYNEFRSSAVKKNESRLAGWGTLILLTLVVLAAIAGAASFAAQLFVYGIFIVPGVAFLFRNDGVPNMAEWEKQEKECRNATAISSDQVENKLNTGASLVECTGSGRSRSYTHAENALNITCQKSSAYPAEKKPAYINSWDLPKNINQPKNPKPYTPTKLEQYLLDREKEAKSSQSKG